MYLVLLAVCVTLSSPALAQEPDRRTRRIVSEVQDELLRLPYYGIFDNLAFAVEPGGTVRLVGQVVNGNLKNDAERVVARIEGVEQVVNEIEVLPASQNDDRIRLVAAQAIYRTSSLERYGFQANPPIHIIVKRGHITLEGVVDTQADKTVAGFRARELPGVFSVTNNLRVE